MCTCDLRTPILRGRVCACQQPVLTCLTGCVSCLSSFSRAAHTIGREVEQDREVTCSVVMAVVVVHKVVVAA